MKKKIILIMLSMTFLSCKKDKLEDDKSILIGTWHWKSSYYEHDKCSSCCIQYDTIVQNNYINSYSMEFLEKGIIKFYINGELQTDNRIIFKNFQYSNFEPQGYVFSIKMNNDENQRLLGRVYEGGDSLYTWDYPFKAINSPCDDYLNIFHKQ